MTKILVYLFCLVTPGPRESIGWASLATGADARELRHIAVRESSLRPVGVHPLDAGNSYRVHANALDAGWLDQKCTHHHGHERGWSSRGVFGLMAAYNLRWLGGCAPPWVLDIPIVSAFAAARKHNARCWTYRIFKTANGVKVVKELNPNGANGWCR